jgi:UDP-N-acetylglucosamine transferase subunit ALG13
MSSVVRSLVREARAVVTHAGVGQMMGAASGKRPIVISRRRRFDEAVDDHQVSLAHRLADEGLVTLVADLTLLPSVPRQRKRDFGPLSAAVNPLAADLRIHLHGALAPNLLR